MPEKYTVKITLQAQEQLREIISYIRFTLQAPGTARKLLDTLEEEIASLDSVPQPGSPDRRRTLAQPRHP